jgi:hypothetical protein
MRKRGRIEKRENIVEVMKSVGWYRRGARKRFQLRCQVP